MRAHMRTFTKWRSRGGLEDYHCVFTGHLSADQVRALLPHGTCLRGRPGPFTLQLAVWQAVAAGRAPTQARRLWIGLMGIFADRSPSRQHRYYRLHYRPERHLIIVIMLYYWTGRHVFTADCLDDRLVFIYQPQSPH